MLRLPKLGGWQLIYEKPTKDIMREFAADYLKPGQFFEKQEAVAWFGKHYPLIRSTTVQMHVEGMSINSASRRHHPNIHQGSGHDFFYKVAKGKYRLWNQSSDPAPQYGDSFTQDQVLENQIEDEETTPNLSEETSNEFAEERDLQHYLEKNIEAIETGLHLYQEEGLSGVEFPAGGGRRIDLLALDQNERFVVIELKVSRGYDKTIGQIMRYMAWVEQNISEGKPVRGIIVASNISEDLKLAASLIDRISLVEYEISFRLKPVQ